MCFGTKCVAGVGIILQPRVTSSRVSAITLRSLVVISLYSSIEEYIKKMCGTSLVMPNKFVC
jgi:hypothetical protein